MKFKSFDDAINFAVALEESAQKFYIDLASKMKRPHMRQVFEEFADEELGHKKKLLAIKDGEINIPKVEHVLDLKISDYVADVEPSTEMDFQQALIVAMKSEKKAYRLYMDLAGKVQDESLRNTFLMLANEEAKHKLRFEIEYDDMMDETRYYPHEG